MLNTRLVNCLPQEKARRITETEGRRRRREGEL
jgi:hypothetical protein